MAKKKLRTVADNTRERILTAAKTLFVKQGFAGTAISQIAKRAHINQSLLYHHFTDKENLWKLVKTDIIKDYLAEFSRVFDDPTLTGETMIRHFVNMRLELAIQKPEIQQMFYWQQIEGNAALRYVPGHDINRWRSLVSQLQSRGELRDDLHPGVILILISAQTNGLMQFIHELDSIHARKKCIKIAADMLCNTLMTRKNHG